MSPVYGSTYRLIDGKSLPTYISKLLCGLIFVRCGGATGTHTAQPKILRWEMFGSLPNTNCSGDYLWYACKIACRH